MLPQPRAPLPASLPLLLALLLASPGRAADPRNDESAPPPLEVVMLSGSEEYESDASLAEYAAYLESRYRIRCKIVRAEGTAALPGVEALDQADLALFFTRRITLPDDQLAAVQRYCASGKPIVAVRTASHGIQNWLEFDALYLGGNYKGHFGRDLLTVAARTPAGREHPILRGVGDLRSRASLYKTAPLAPDAVPLLEGSIPESTQPLAWVRERGEQRVFYTSLGAREDFENGAFRVMLARAILWAARRDPDTPPTPPEPQPRVRTDATLHLPLRRQVPDPDAPGQWRDVVETRAVPASKTAIVICDMWDQHWCRGATARVDAMIPRVENLLNRAREQGVLVVHAPSDTMSFYQDVPQRDRLRNAPKIPKPPLRDLHEPPLPIDDSDGGCDTPGDETRQAWIRQHPGISIHPADGITDSGDEFWNLIQNEGIERVVVLGVHTNMCILNRGFAIRNLSRLGVDCVLVRDLTDAMYNPAKPPYVSHEQGTELVIRHIERHLCPTVTSDEILRGFQP